MTSFSGCLLRLVIVLQDIDVFTKHKFDFAKKFFDDVPDEVLQAEPLLYCHFATGIGEPKYMPVSCFCHQAFC